MAYSAAERTKRYRQRQYARIMALPPVPCACGCGQPIPPINKMLKAARYAHGHNPTSPPPKATKKTQAKAARSRRRPGNEWRTRGYVRVTLHPEEARNHPTALQHSGTGESWSIPRSHLIWNHHHPEEPVMPGEHVHHRNHVRDDDWIDNLEKLDGREHIAVHARARRQKRSATDGRFVANDAPGGVS